MTRSHIDHPDDLIWHQAVHRVANSEILRPYLYVLFAKVQQPRYYEWLLEAPADEIWEYAERLCQPPEGKED